MWMQFQIPSTQPAQWVHLLMSNHVCDPCLLKLHYQAWQSIWADSQGWQPAKCMNWTADTLLVHTRPARHSAATSTDQNKMLTKFEWCDSVGSDLKTLWCQCAYNGDIIGLQVSTPIPKSMNAIICALLRWSALQSWRVHRSLCSAPQMFWYHHDGQPE